MKVRQRVCEVLRTVYFLLGNLIHCTEEMECSADSPLENCFSTALATLAKATNLCTTSYQIPMVEKLIGY